MYEESTGRSLNRDPAIERQDLLEQLQRLFVRADAETELPATELLADAEGCVMQIIRGHAQRHTVGEDGIAQPYSVPVNVCRWHESDGSEFIDVIYYPDMPKGIQQLHRYGGERVEDLNSDTAHVDAWISSSLAAATFYTERELAERHSNSASSVQERLANGVSDYLQSPAGQFERYYQNRADLATRHHLGRTTIEGTVTPPTAP